MRVFALCLFAAAQAAAAWKAGAAKIDITPSEPVWLGGYAARTKPSEGVRHRIWVRALALEDQTGARAAIVTFDLSSIPRSLGDRIATLVRERHGIARERLVLNVSHTHSAPITTAYLAARPQWKIGAANEAAVERFTEALVRHAAQVTGDALAVLAPATLHYGQGFAGFAVNRRRQVMARKLPGPVDHDVPVLAVRAADGAMKAIVASYSCHATVLSDSFISNDWPGYAIEAMERDHPGATALFVQAFGADANPLPRRDERLARMYGELLAEAARQVTGSKMTLVEGPLRAHFEDATLELRPVRPRAELERIRDTASNRTAAGHARLLLERLDRGESIPLTHPYPVQVWRFGSGLKLIALGGEVVADYAIRFRERYGWDNTWLAGYSNDVITYIPSRRVLAEGGYEGGEVMINTPFPGPWAESVEEIIAAKVDELMRR